MDKELFTYLDNIDMAFSKAVSETRQTRSSIITINGLNFRLNFTGERIYSNIMPAFNHLICKNNFRCHFTINFWDDISTDNTFPESPWSEEITKVSDKLLMFNQDQLHMLYNPDSKVYSLIDVDSGKAYYHVPDAGSMPCYEKSSPMRMILHWCLEKHGLYLIHSASVGLKGRAILLAGKGTSGKSTTALACLMNGLDYLGDDYIAVRRREQPEVFSIYNSVEVNNDILDKLPELKKYVYNPGRQGLEKAMIFLDRHYGDKIVKDSLIQAIVMPVVTGKSTSRIYRIQPIMAFAELASSTIFQMPGSRRDMLSNLKKIMEGIPVFAIDLGSNFEEVTDTLRKFIKSL